MILKNSFVLFSLCLTVIVIYGCKDRSLEISNTQKNGAKQLGIDTIITYDLNSISTEGASATVEYKSGQIFFAKTTIFSGTGKGEVLLSFKKDSIKIEESIYKYTVPITDIDTEFDMKLESRDYYWINYSGDLIRGGENRKTDILKDFKEQIPFSLTN